MLHDVLLLQKREILERLGELYVERIFDRDRVSHDLINVVLGPRRAGKSFFAMRLIASLGNYGYVNFDDERLVAIDDFDSLISAVDAIYEHPKQLLLDEVQNVARWELLVNRLQRQGYQLTITGSNAHLLSFELATHLTGRHLPIVIFPFSFAEYLGVRSGELTTREKAEACRSYLETGGFPEPLIKGISRRDYLSTLLRSILFKDIVTRHHIRAHQGIEDLAMHLTANVAQRYSLETLTQVTRLRSKHTVQKYLRYLEEAFLFFSVPRFSFKTREQVRANRKSYCIDNGFVTSVAFQFSSDRGKLLENAVAVALRKRQMQGDVECFYWQGPAQEEVDFLVKEGTQVTQLIQVCMDPTQPKSRAREIRALLKASKELGCKELLVLTDATEQEEEVSWQDTKGVVRFRPVWKWLLDNP